MSESTQQQPRPIKYGIQWRHIRPLKKNYPYSHIIYNRGGATIAFCQNADRTWSYAIAACSPEDNFVKKTGRTIAVGRLDSSRYAMTTAEPMTEEQFMDYVDSELRKMILTNQKLEQFF